MKLLFHITRFQNRKGNAYLALGPLRPGSTSDEKTPATSAELTVMLRSAR